MDDKNIPMPMTIISNDKKRQYPVAYLRVQYITSEDHVDEFARKYGISSSTIFQFIKKEGWDELRAENRQKGATVANELIQDQLKEALNAQIQCNALNIIKFKNRIETLNRYVAEFGDLYIRDEEGELVLDSNGLPLCHAIPQSPIDTMAKKQNLEGMVVLGKLLNQWDNLLNTPGASAPKVFEQNEYSKFLESRKKDD